MNERNKNKKGSKFRLFLKKGQKVRSLVDVDGVVCRGDILEFSNFNAWLDAYAFKNSEGKKVVLINDTDFFTLHEKETIKSLIDIALSLNDREWFDDLVYILKNEIEEES